ACHDGKTQLRQSSADLPGELVVGVTFGKPRRAKNRDAGTDKVQRAKAPNELSRDPEDREELAAPRPRTFEENPLRRRTGRYVLLPAATEMRALASSARSRKPLSVSRLAVFIASLACARSRCAAAESISERRSATPASTRTTSCEISAKPPSSAKASP